MNNDLLIARALTWRYMIALSLVATLSTAAWISLRLVISEQKNTAAIVNVSGRQRMLSQQTALFSTLLLNTPKDNRAVIRHQLNEAADLMRRSHSGLTRGDDKMGLPPTMSPTVRTMYFDGPDALDRQVEKYLAAVQSLLLAKDEELTPDNPQLRYIVTVSPALLVSSLDKMVSQYQLEGEEAIGRLQKAETMFWIFTLLLLTLEAAFIFRPFASHLKIIIAKLLSATDSLYESRERLAAKTEQIEAANKELEAFSYSVSHDLRTPLRAIDGFSRILLDDYSDRLDDEGKRLLNVVWDNTNRMGQLIDDTLKFSRAGRTEITFSEIDMEGLAHEVCEELLPPLTEHGLKVEIGHIPPSMCDRAMMRQVFVNLLSNAIKFSRFKDEARIIVGCSIEGNEAIYFVKDNGAGFDMHYVDKLFGVFQRLHAASEFEGTGIGLAIVKRIVTRHGGRVWAEGKLGEGSTIYFTLPLHS